MEKEVRKIRFATAIPQFCRKRGGAERYLVDLCESMAGRDFEVHVYAEDWDEEPPGVQLHRIRTLPLAKSLRQLSFAIQATRALRRGDYDVTLGVGHTLTADVLQPHGGVHWAWFWRSLRAYDHPVRWALKFLGRILSPKQWVSGYIEDAPYKSRNLSKIVAVSEMVKQDMVRWYGVTEDQVLVIYNGVDTERFHPRNRVYREELRRQLGIGQERVVLFVSNNFRMKGLQPLIGALATIKHEGCPPFRLVVLGRDRGAPYLRLARNLGIGRKVLFVGSTEEPERYYGASDLLVHPTFYDACSLTVLEALASGLPVITTSCNGASGMVGPEEGRILRDPRDMNQLAALVRPFLEDRESPLTQESSVRLAELLSRRRNFDQMMDLFRKVAEKKGTR